MGALRREQQLLAGVEWSRLAVFSRGRALALTYLAAVPAMLVVIVLAFPQAVASAESGGVLARFVFSQLLVVLLWMTFTWFLSGLIVPVVGNALSGRPLVRAAAELPRSISILATWTGRLTMPVVLASLAAGVAGFPVTRSDGRSILVSVGGIQLGMLFVALLIVLTTESVRISLSSLVALPPITRSVTAVLLPLGAWCTARAIWPQYPMTASIARSLAPSGFDATEREQWTESVVSNALHIPVGLGLAVFVLACALILVVRDKEDRSRPVVG